MLTMHYAICTMPYAHSPYDTLQQIGSFGITLASIFTWNLWTGIPFALLSVLFAVQTGKVRFVFDNEAIELKINKKGNKTLDPSRENVVVGGKNRWDYSTIVNWFFIPSKNFPILVYFKV